MLIVAAAWACPDTVASLDRAREALLEVRTADATADLDQVEQGFGCGTPASPDLVARYFLARGVVEALEGRSGEVAFRAAALVQPDLWVDDYGPILREEYQQAAALAQPLGTLQLDPIPTVRRVWVDGREAQAQVRVEAGPHLVQVASGGLVEFGAVVVAVGGETVIVSTGLVPIVVPTVAPEPLPQPGGVSPWLVAGGATGLTAVSLGVASLSRTPAMRSAESVDELTQAYTQQKWATRGSYALFALSAVSLTVYVNEEHTRWW